MKIALRITLDIDEQVWADEYGLEVSEVRDDVREYIRNALYSMPIEPRSATVV